MNIYDIYKNPVGKIYADATGIDAISTIITTTEVSPEPEPEPEPEPLPYFYFEALQAGSTFKINQVPIGNTYQYSNDGENWTNLGTTTITLANVRDRVYIRKSSDKGYWQAGPNTTGNSNYRFNTTGNLKIGGYISTLAYKEIGHTSPILKAPMSYIFYNCTAITDASDLKLDFTELTEGCYSNMFCGCTNLRTAPELLATTLASGCYRNMFQYCANLNSITVQASSWNTSYANFWVSGVSPTGTFTCPAELDIPTGASGIPEGWTRVDL